MPGLDDLGDFFQTEQFCDSMDEFHSEKMNTSFGELVTLLYSPELPACLH